MERNCILLFREAERFFPALRDVEPRIYENLLAPWHVEGTAVGTLWAIKHKPEGQFDAEDARVLESLARLAAAAFQMASALDEAKAERVQLEQRTTALHKAEARLNVLVSELSMTVESGPRIFAQKGPRCWGGEGHADERPIRRSWSGLHSLIGRG